MNNRRIAALIHRDPGAMTGATALTLLSAMLSLIGDRVNSLPLPVVGKNLGRSDAAEARIWLELARPAQLVPAPLAGLAAAPPGGPTPGTLLR